MAPAVGDIVQITDVQTYLGQTVYNVYFYQLDALEPAVDYVDIAEAFDNVVRSQILTVQSAAVTHPTILVKNLTNGLDIWEQVDSQPGTQGGEGMPSYVSLGFRLLRTTALTRHGSKRIGGLAESLINGNNVASAGLASVTALATVFSLPIERVGTVDHDLTASPVIVGRFPQGDPNEGELDLSKINPVSGSQFIRVTTQVTRRAGRGV